MGADYKKQQKSLVHGGCYGNLAANTTEWIPLSGPRFRGNELDSRQVIPFACRLTNLNVRSSLPPGGADTFTYTVMVNGLASALNLVITGAAVVAGPNLSIVAITAGDEVDLRIISSATAQIATHNWSLELNR